MEKVKLPKEVAEAIETARNKLMFSDGDILTKVVRQNWDSPEMQILNEFVQCNDDRLTIAKALVNGYEVDMTPEEKVADYVRHLREVRDEPSRKGPEYSGRIDSVIAVLNILGIKVSGVNAE